MTPEFSRIIRAHDIGGHARQQAIEADAGECAALAARFGLLRLARLTATFELRREAAGVRVTGQVQGSGEQACVATGEPVPFLLTEPVRLMLSETAVEGDEIELAEPDLDTDTLDGDIIDMGEIAAQALALALDPYPRSTLAAPGVISESEARVASSPFSVLRKG
jgi:uncharacterized metal-binding protein YceD (DUF177 family)